MQLPNALWLSIIAALQLIVNTNYPDMWWSPVALAALIAVGKLIQVNVTEPAPTPQSDFGGPAPQRDSAIVRFLVK